MPQSREQFLITRHRIRSVLDYMAEHLDDEHITLHTLAEVAHLSHCHFERVYTQKVGEPPMATLRRLRLRRARDTLARGRARSVSSLAFEAGYGSIAAFSRAFSREFGHAPTRVMQQDGGGRSMPALDIVALPALPGVSLPYDGRASEVVHAGDELSWRVARSGLANWRHWAIHPEGWVDPQRHPEHRVRMRHFIPSDTLPALAGVERSHLPAGEYARLCFVGPHRAEAATLAARVRAETGRAVAAGPTLRHFPTVTPYTAPSERVTCVFLPLAASGR